MIHAPIGFAIALATVLALVVVAPARGDTDTGQLTVTATVSSGCALSGGTLNFGEYLSGQPNNLDVNGQINFVNCPVGTLKFELDGGGGGNINARRMTSSENNLNYQIYRDANRTAIWGTGTSAAQTQLLVPQSGQVLVYGRIPGSQNVPAGSYTDTVTITLTF